MNGRRLVARQRRRLAQVAWRLALGPVAGASPRDYVRSIARQSYRPEVARHLEGMTLLSDSEFERYDFDRAPPAEFRLARSFDQRHIYTMRDVCVSPFTGLTWLPDGGPLLLESFGPLGKLLGHERWTLEDPLVRPRQHVSGTVIVLPDTSYYHWLLETLPCVLHAFAAEPDATLVLPAKLPRFAEEAVELLGFRDVRRIAEPFTAERLVFATRLYRTAMREDIELVRNALLPKVEASGEERIFVSRRLARRVVANEPELAALFERKGFRSIAAETLSFAEQVSLFASARLVAGQHGAGLANLVFASELERVLEIFTPGYVRDSYAHLSAARGVGYEWFFCNGGGSSPSIAPLEEIEAAL